jgi:hypothetical protein
LQTLPNGRLPPLTRVKRQELRDHFNKPDARVFVSVHVCGSGKSWDMMIPAVVEHVAEMESRRGFVESDLFVVIAAPTRKLVESLRKDVNKALDSHGLTTRAVSYRDEDVDRWTRGVIATCTHSLHKFARGNRIQLLIVDEVQEAIESIVHLNPNRLSEALAALAHAEEALWADAMAGKGCKRREAAFYRGYRGPRPLRSQCLPRAF